MEKEFVPYELAVKLQALGFDEPCFSYYNLNNRPNFFGSDVLMDTHCVQVNRPTLSQAFRWFREKYGYLSYIDMDNYSFYRYTIYKGKGILEAPFETYEEAELACLNRLIELMEIKTNEHE